LAKREREDQILHGRSNNTLLEERTDG
jgi:hypothetical protein